MQEACDMVGPCFLVHSIINEEGEISSMVGGDPYKAWLEGTKETYRMQKVPMKQQADVTIVSAGGYPKDTNLYQGTKCYTTAEIATKKGGIIITMIEAEDVMEPPAYLGSFKYKNLEDMEKGLRGCFTIPFFVAFENLITAMTHTVYIVTGRKTSTSSGKRPIRSPWPLWKKPGNWRKNSWQKKERQTIPSISSPTAVPLCRS